MEEVKLLGFWASPFVYKVIWALKLKGIEYDYTEEDLSNKSELLLQYNPLHKKVPLLVHGGKPIAESLVILEYIEETWPHNPLLPCDAFERALARFWIQFGTQNVNSSQEFFIFHSLIYDVFVFLIKNLFKGWTFFSFLIASEAAKEEAAKEVAGQLKSLQEQCLGNKKFFGGDALNLVDISFGWLTLWFDCIQEVVGIKLLEPTTLPRLHEWTKNFKEHPVIKENLPDPEKLLIHYRRFRESYSNK